MEETITPTRIFSRWRWLYRLILIGTVVLSSVIPVYAQSEPLRIHPALLTLAEESPNEIIRVIVQQNAQERISGGTLSRAGAQVTRELPIINGVVLELPARKVIDLARARGVRWITVDAPVIPAATPGSSCNMLTNPGFENGMTQWDDWENTLDKQISGHAHTGAFAVRLGQPSGAFSQSLQSATAGGTYTASGMFQRQSSNVRMSVGIDFFDSNWNEIDEVYTEIPPSDNYVPVSIAGVAPAGTVHMSIWVWKDPGGSLYLDDLRLHSSSMDSGACAGYPATAGYNVLANGDFEAGTTDWWLNNSSLQVTSTAYNGTKAIHLGQAAGSIAQSAGIALPGTLYTARGTFHRPIGAPWSGMGIDFFDVNWNEISDVYVTIPETSSYAPVTVSGIAPPGTVHMSVWIHKNSGSELYIDDVSLVGDEVPDAFVQSTGTNQLWHDAQPRTGQGITVAVVDSGIADHPDLNIAGSNNSRVLVSEDLTNSADKLKDAYGHGTHVAGIIGGNGSASNGIHRGIAPGVNLINMRISDGKGMTYASDLITGLQWLYEHQAQYNIRVVNISLNSTVPESYHTSPIAAAVELLWFKGMTVVVSAGNNGNGNGAVPLFSPANDPFVITVGATDDRGTGSLDDDVVATFSAYGTTIEGFAKPDLVAPGRNIVSLSAGNNATVTKEHPSHKVGSQYFRMSGTSMSAPVVSGVVALLLQDEPNLTPDQVKYR
ncbi:MAG: S8 family serine peptidase, partial [Caldilineaceae bacterium]|nr:S8 family serine peptidase [Caldilineaceae bacterium]